LPVAALTLPLGLALFYGTQTLRGFQEIRHVVVGTVFVQFLVKVAVTLALFWLGLGLLGYLFAVVVAMVVAVWWLWRGVRARLAALSIVADDTVAGTEHHAEWRPYAAVMYLNSLLSVSTSHLDRFLVGLFAGPALVGVLMVARMIQNLPAIFLQVFIVVAGPMFAAAHAVSDTEARQRLYHLTTDWLVRLSLPLLVFLVVFGGPLLDVFGETFAEEGRVALWILLAGQGVSLACGQVGSVLNMSGQEREMLRIAFVSTVLMLAGLPPLTYGMGIEGAALAVSVSVVFSNLAALYTARARIGLRWWDSRYGRWGLPGLLTVGVALGIQHWFPAPGVLGLSGIVALLYASFHGAYLGQGLSGDDRELLDSLRERLGRPRAV
jgi:O-antigen/teichoic acid export membrane protein